MKSIPRIARIATLVCHLVTPIRANESDIFEFFAEEARAILIITASRLPLSVRQSPATVYVMTGEALRSMGVQTLWDALRTVPGVDVIASRTAYAGRHFELLPARGVTEPGQNGEVMGRRMTATVSYRF